MREPTNRFEAWSHWRARIEGRESAGTGEVTAPTSSVFIINGPIISKANSSACRFDAAWLATAVCRRRSKWMNIDCANCVSTGWAS